MVLVFLKDVKYFYLDGGISTSAFGSRSRGARLKLLMTSLRKQKLDCPQVALMCYKFKATLVTSFFLLQAGLESRFPTLVGLFTMDVGVAHSLLVFFFFTFRLHWFPVCF